MRSIPKIAIFFHLALLGASGSWLSAQAADLGGSLKPSEASSTPASLLVADETTRRSVGLIASSGTHQAGMGVGAAAIAYRSISFIGDAFPNSRPEPDEFLGISTRLSCAYYQRDIGIPGEKVTGKLHIAALYSLGPKNGLFQKFPSIEGVGTHNIGFGYSGYLTTDSTSQVTGQLDYSFISGKDALYINYENDTMLFYSSDKYRTAAFKISYFHDTGNHIVGIAGGFNLWAGERRIDLVEIWNHGDIRIPAEVHRGSTVTLYNAKEYSSDVVYISFMLDSYCLSLGYDSELFKSLIHNNIHYLLNDGNLPIIDRADRFYLLFKIGCHNDLF